MNEEHARAAADIAEVEAANTAFYEALERGDLDALTDSWLPGEELTVSCVHPGWPVLTGRRDVLRSYALIMANTDYIQFFLTDVNVTMTGETALVTCTENILSGGPAEDGDALGPLVGSSSPPTCSGTRRTAGSSGPTTGPRSWPTPTRTTTRTPPPDGPRLSSALPSPAKPPRRGKHPHEWVRDGWGWEPGSPGKGGSQPAGARSPAPRASTVGARR